MKLPMELKVLRKQELNKTVAVVVGTRPGIIKFAPVISELSSRKTDFFIIHAGQHYSYNMDKQFFEQLDLPAPKYINNETKNFKLHGQQTARMIEKIEKVLIQEKPSLVIVGGDANTNLAGALAARKLGVTLAHLEAGLRSNDWTMPEEHNRVMIDHISEILLPPTKQAENNLKKDNVKGKIFVVGNTISDAVTQHAKRAERKSNILKQLELKTKKFFLLTVHREENVDYKENLCSILDALEKLKMKYDYPIVFPAHPRTIERLKTFRLMKKLECIENIHTIEAVPYLDFLKLLSSCLIVLTDSGGIQEEACILKIPCITLRKNTERPETVTAGGNIIAENESKKILHAVEYFLNDNTGRNWKNPFGQDNAKKIVDILVSYL